MQDEKVKVSYGIRDAVIVGIAGAYLVTVAALVVMLPVNATGASGPVPDGRFDLSQLALNLPYLQHVHAKMIEIGSPADEITEKIEFLRIAFLAMFFAYGVGMVAALATFLTFGIATDPVTLLLRRFPMSSHVGGGIGYCVILSGAGLCCWIAIDGLGPLAPTMPGGRYVDYIIESDISIWRSVGFMSLSLLSVLILLRIGLCYIAIGIGSSEDGGSSPAERKLGK